MSFNSIARRGVPWTWSLSLSVWSSLRKHWCVSLGALLTAAAVTVAAVAWSGASHERRLLGEQRAVLGAVQNRIPLLLSYRYATLKQDLARSIDQTTGEFKSQYSELVDGTIRAVAQDRRVTTEATVVGAGIVSQTSSSADVLVFVSQRTSIASAGLTQVSTPLKVSMVLVNGTWKISGIGPL